MAGQSARGVVAVVEQGDTECILKCAKDILAEKGL